MAIGGMSSRWPFRAANIAPISSTVTVQPSASQRARNQSRTCRSRSVSVSRQMPPFGVLAGLIASNRLELRPHWREFVFVGVLGGFTTFSTFAGDVVMLARGGLQASAMMNVLLQVALAVAGLYAGLVIALRTS